MKFTKEQEKEFEEMSKNFEERLNKYKTYTWDELNRFEKEGVSGEVCFCRIKIANTMTLECVNCGKIQYQYAKAFARRSNSHKE